MIAPMAKVEVLGPRRLLPEVLLVLQRGGALQLREPPSTPGGPAGTEEHLIAPDEAARASRLRDALTRMDRAAMRLPSASEDPLELPNPAQAGFAAALDAAEARLQELEQRRTVLLEERDATTRLARLLTALVPLHAEVRVPPRSRALGLALRADRSDVLPLIEGELARATDRAAVVRARAAGEDVALLVLIPASRASSVSALLFERGLEEVRLPGPYEGVSPARALLSMAERARSLPAEIAAAEAECAAYARRLSAAIALARKEARTAVDRFDAEARCGETAHAFVVWGWVPRPRLEELRQTVARELGGRVEVLEAELTAGDEARAPVVIVNHRWLRPFQLLLALAPLPRYGSVDPTPWLALFYPLFVGFVIGDVAFGVLAVAVALAARRRRWGGSLGRDAAAIALSCGIACVGFGLVFGEALGSLGERMGLHVFLERREALRAFAALSLATGVVHLAVGMALGLYESSRRRAAREAASRGARLVLLLAGAQAALCAAGWLPHAGLRPAAIAAAAALCVDLACHGPLALLEAVLAVGRVLSYARLLALGLASVMLAEVANDMAAALPGVPGVTLGIFLHAVNFTLGIVSPAIAALRLQYVEFFENFYREGGRPFRPFALA